VRVDGLAVHWARVAGVLRVEKVDLRTLINLVGLVVAIGGGFYFTGRVSQNLETLTALVGDQERRIDEHDRLLGRGVPPPEVLSELAAIRRRLESLEDRKK